MPLRDKESLIEFLDDKSMSHWQESEAWKSAFHSGYVCALETRTYKRSYEEELQVIKERLRSRYFYASRYYLKRLRRISKMARLYSSFNKPSQQ